ncbi:MAG: hypothetical protein NVV73_03390 [Cellvibrionaceae bacterium]|nr:hypothetical protein [Cellvibrionaceae bacterium]
MKSALPKVLDPIAGLPMVAHVVKAARRDEASEAAVVVGREAEGRGARGGVALAPEAEVFLLIRSGWARRMRCWRPAKRSRAPALTTSSSSSATWPLVQAEALADSLRAGLAAGAAVVVTGSLAPDPKDMDG